MNNDKYIIISLFYISITLFFSCGKSEAALVTTLEISRDEVTFWPESSEVIIEIHSNGDVVASSSTSWCKAEVMPNNSSRLRISVEKNDVIGVDRSANIIVSAKGISKTIKVVQLSEDLLLEVHEQSVYFNENQTTEFSLTVSSNTNYTLELPSWIEELETEIINVIRKKHNFKVQTLSQPESKRIDDITIKVDKHNKQENLTVPVGQSNKKSELSTASYNILVGSWQERKELVYTIINTYDFDIWGTQEGTLVHLTDIKNNFDKYNYIGVGRDGDNKGEFSAIFYKSDRFEVIEEGNFWYSNTPEKPSYGWDATNYRRICTWGKFLDKETYNSFYYFNSHFDHQGVIARKESAKLLLTMIKLNTESGFPVFASGDFNSQPNSEPISLLKSDGLLKDSRDMITNPIGPEGTFNGLDPDTEPKNRIDYIFVSKEVGVQKYKVIDDRPNGKCPSDHDPVFIDVEF